MDFSNYKSNKMLWITVL